MTTSQAIQEFLIASEADGLVASTLRWYRSILRHLSDHFGERDLSDITTNDMRAYLIHIRATFSSPDTIHAHIRVMHRFWTWCAREYDGLKNPMRNIKYPAQTKQRYPKAVDLGDVLRLFELIPEDAMGQRDRAIVAFLIDTGCRAHGLVSLRRVDLDLVKRQAVVNEKGDKTRQVVFTRFTGDLLLRWLSAAPQSDHVFINLRTYKPLTVDGLQQVLRRLRKKAGITGRTNPHAFRHAFAREYLKAGGDLATLSRILGHSDIATTAAHYAVFTQDEIADIHEAFSPINELLKADPPDSES